MKFKTTRRPAVKISSTDLVKVELLQREQPLPLVIQPTVEGINLVSWATSNRDAIATWLLQHGGLLFRNFNIREVVQFEQFIQTLSGTLLDYSYRSTPRSQVSGKIYT
jgi:ABC-type molybdate transport system permease subunit